MLSSGLPTEIEATHLEFDRKNEILHCATFRSERHCGLLTYDLRSASLREEVILRERSLAHRSSVTMTYSIRLMSSLPIVVTTYFSENSLPNSKEWAGNCTAPGGFRSRIRIPAIRGPIRPFYQQGDSHGELLISVFEESEKKWRFSSNPRFWAKNRGLVYW